jgi:hypothetical protein
MLEEFIKFYQIDWRIFMAGASAWLEGRSPYGALPPEFSAGAFAYPPTALPWLALFVPLGVFGFYLWTALELLLWWWLMRGDRSQLPLLCWTPFILHMVEGQSTLAAVLVLWAASRAERRGWLWGLALAWAMTKPQVAIVPLLWLLWQDRAAPSRWRLWGGIVGGTALLALPPTLLHPGIWSEWLAALPAYRWRLTQMAAWQGPAVVLFALAAYLWHRSGRGGWQWWLAAGAFPQTSFYALVALIPVLRPRPGNWSFAGMALAAVLIGPVRPLTLPWILSGHLLAAWMIAGGPQPRLVAPAPVATPTEERT